MRNNLTPKQVALVIATTSIREAIDKKDFSAYISNPAESKLIEEQLMLLHRNLVEKSRLPIVTYLAAK